MTALVRTAAPAEEPITLEEAKAHLRVDIANDDELIEALITAARMGAEEFTRRAFISQDWRLWLDTFPGAAEPWWDGMREGAATGVLRRFIHLPRSPLQAIVAVKTYDEANVESIFDPTLYFVDTASEPGRLALRSNAAWPVAQRQYNGIRVDFTAGYGDASAVPQPLKQGMLSHIAFLYENRGDGQTLSGHAAAPVPEVAQMLYQPYRVHHLV
jgi:hypothetical protein